MTVAPQARRRSATDMLDGAAMLCSAACLMHCVALPLLILALPMLARWLSVPESAHLWLLAFAAPAAGVALWSGYRRHRDRLPVIGGTAGLVLLGAGTLAEGPAETAFTVAGSLCVVAAHLLNLRLRRRCRCCPCTPPGHR